MARTNDFSRVLWLVTSTWLAGCGRIGFGEADHGDNMHLPDAPGSVDATPDTPVIKGPPVVTVTPPVNLTSVCGDAATTAMVMVGNSGESDLVITSVSTRDGVFQASLPAPITVGPGSQAMIEITVPAAVIGTDVGGRFKTDQLLFAANATVEPVDLSTKVMGANLQVVNPAPPATLGFTAASGCPAPQNATLRNAGNMPATMTTILPANFTMNGTSGASIAGGASVFINLRPFSQATGACSGVGTIQYQLTGAPNCGTSGAIAATLRATYTIGGGASSCFCS